MLQGAFGPEEKAKAREKEKEKEVPTLWILGGRRKTAGSRTIKGIINHPHQLHHPKWI